MKKVGNKAQATGLNFLSNGGEKMKLNAPTQNVWLIAVIVGVLGIVGTFVAIPFVSVYAFWFVVVGFALLVLSTLLKGL